MTLYRILTILILTSLLPALAAVFPSNTQYEICFTPDQDCTSLIVKTIASAKSSIYVQAYSFTSAPIAKALVEAQKRGVKVNVVLDKSQTKQNSYSSAKYLANQKIPVWIDYKPAIAHNKVIIIDEQTVITGSFNFTKAAQYKNTENVLIIHNQDLAAAYFTNLQKRKAVSSTY